MWKKLPKSDLYEVSSDGRVRNRETGLVLTPMWTGRRGVRQYATVVLHGRQVKVHRAVLLAFRGPPPKGRLYGLHRDDNTRNNTLQNLFWGSPADNARAVRWRKDQKITSHQRAEARAAHAGGESIKDLANRYGISYVRMWEICNTHWECK